MLFLNLIRSSKSVWLDVWTKLKLLKDNHFWWLLVFTLNKDQWVRILFVVTGTIKSLN